LTLPNRPPFLKQAGEVFTVRPGSTINLSLGVQDPDGDSVTIEQFAGPGTLRGNRWSWTVPKPYWGPSWQLVGFALKDSCGAQNRAYFVVRVVQPPVVSDAHVTVRPCRGVQEVKVSMWVVDPDTPVEDLRLHIEDPLPPGIAVEGQAIRAQPWSSGHVGVAELVVRVAPWIHPGNYEVRVTLWDPEGVASSAWLKETVLGNRPPQARPPELRGELTVTLTPKGIVRSPVAMRIPRFGIPTATKFSWRLPVFRPSTPQAFPLSSLP